MSEKKIIDIADSEVEYIDVYGARLHNLKNIDVKIPRNKLVVITGISGSGKSSLAFDTIYAEGQRRYMESFGSYARQFIGDMERPDVDKIDGLSPVISIEQKTTNKNPRSTVGTVTEIYDFMRLLYARAGDAYSPVTGERLVKYTEDQIAIEINRKFVGEKIALLAPLVKGRKGHYRELFETIVKQGYNRVRVDGVLQEVKPKMQLDRYSIHDIEVVVDRLDMGDKSADRLKQSLQTALKAGKGVVMVINLENNQVFTYSKNLMDAATGESFEEPSPNTFSFNSPYGACPKCRGLGHVYEIDIKQVIPDATLSINDGGLEPLGEPRENYVFAIIKDTARKYKFTMGTPINKIPEKALNYILYGSEEAATDFEVGYDDASQSKGWNGLIPLLYRSQQSAESDGLRRWAEEYMQATLCPLCKGTRLKTEALNFKLANNNIAEVSALDLNILLKWVKDLSKHLSTQQKTIAKDIIKELTVRIGFLLDVGLEYLSLNRPSRSLSGGESQRIRLATQIGSQLVGVTYILDEPSIGLHQRDNERLISSLRNLAKLGNTVLVVEHDKDIMQASDYLIDIGPRAGVHGGHVIAADIPEKFYKYDTITARYLTGRDVIATPEIRRKGNGKEIVLKGATGNNLKNLSVVFPLGKMICVTGVSGSGKSTLINDTLYPILNTHFYHSLQKPLAYKSIKGLEHIDKVIEIDQSPIGRTPRSNPSTYIGVFTDIRALFANLPEAKIRGYKPGRFSFNVKGGRCEECGGGGLKTIEMNFLPTVNVECPRCAGKRYNRETLEVRYKGKSIADVLDMTVEDACPFFENIPSIYRRIKTMLDVGLGYIKLGQQATTLSGGEAQRVKLSTELSKKDTGSTFYILDEPTTGLHFEDIRILMHVLNQLVDKGNTVLIIEHNMDVIKLADHIIDIGPEGGRGGGQILFTGTPEQLVKVKESHTAKFLKRELA